MENQVSLSKRMKNKFKGNESSNSCIYFLGIIGASIYYFSIATSFGAGVLGFLKAIAWPAVLVYKSLVYLA